MLNLHGATNEEQRDVGETEDKDALEYPVVLDATVQTAAENAISTQITIGNQLSCWKREAPAREMISSALQK